MIKVDYSRYDYIFWCFHCFRNYKKLKNIAGETIIVSYDTKNRVDTTSLETLKRPRVYMTQKAIKGNSCFTASRTR